VLLLSLNGELPEIGYVVSLEYIYYVFFGLCLVCIGITLFMEWLQHNGKHPKIMEPINFSLHIIYLTTVTLTIIYYLVTYHGRFA
jgi:branched-chain amino acid transport system substrate-binding protein